MRIPSQHPIVRVVEEIEPDEVMSNFMRRLLSFKRAGICEYWAIDTSAQRVHIYSLRRDGPSSGRRLPADWERTEAEFFAPSEGALV